jgi:hypothetical protein
MLNLSYEGREKVDKGKAVQCTVQARHRLLWCEGKQRMFDCSGSQTPLSDLRPLSVDCLICCRRIAQDQGKTRPKEERLTLTI